MYGQPSGRPHGAPNGAPNGYAPSPPQPQPDEYAQYAPAGVDKQAAVPPRRQPQQPFYEPAPQPQLAPPPPQQPRPHHQYQQQAQEQPPPFYSNPYAPPAGSPASQTVYQASVTVSPTLSSMSGGGQPPVPPSMPPLPGYGQQAQYGNGYAQQQFMQPPPPPQQPEQPYVPYPRQEQQEHPQRQAQLLAQQFQTTSVAQAAQGIALQFGAAQVMAGIAQQFGGPGGSPGTTAAAALQSFGVPAYFTGSPSSDAPGDANAFMHVPKHYFAVNHAYVLKKLALLLMPFQRRSWSRRAGVDPRQFERQGTDGATAFLPPRDDVNAPDLYIPVMSFVSYVLLVGFVFGTRGKFNAEVLAKYFSKGFGVLTLEVLVIKLGLYLISARATPWLDVIAYRGYKFVGVIIAMVCDLLLPRLYYFVFFYTSFAMAIFLMRSHRRIILPRESEQQTPADLPQRNAFLLFICALQFPIYWLLILDVR
jgi:protein transport protein YIF1